MKTCVRVAAFVAAWLGAAGQAGAGISYEFAFRSTDGLGSVISGGWAAGSDFTFTSLAAARACDPVSGTGCAVLDLFFTTTDYLIVNSVTVGFDNATGLAAAGAQEWFGVGVGPVTYRPLIPVECDVDSCGSFTGAVGPPNAPPSLPPGTYHLGTIIWDTSGASQGQSGIFSFIRPAFDATGAVRPPGGAIVDITGTESHGSGLLTIIPEPSTAALLALGLLGAALVSRRRG